MNKWVKIGLISAFSLNPSAWGRGVLVFECKNQTPYTTNSLKIDVLISNDVATTTITQSLTLELDENCPDSTGSLLFPLQEEEASSTPAFSVGGQPLQPILLNAEQALRYYLTQTNNTGKTNTLAFSNNELFLSDIKNSYADDSVLIEISYTQKLECKSELCQYYLPIDLGACRNHPIGKLNIDVEISGSLPVVNVFSPSHNVKPYHHSDKNVTLRYSEALAPPNRPFRLLYSLSSKAFGLNYLTHRSDYSYHSQKDPGGDGFFLGLLAPKYDVHSIEVVPKEFLFIIDQSGSMSGNKIIQAKDALQYCLSNLNSDDKFNIVSFQSLVSFFSQALVDVNSANMDNARAFVDNISAGGGTNINEALLTGLGLFQQSTRPKYIIFLTDGQATAGIVDRASIVQNVKEANIFEARLFAFGVGNNVNTFLLDQLTSDNNGLSIYVREEESIDEKISQFFRSVSTPLLSDVRIDYPSLNTYSLFPKAIPDLFLGSHVAMVGRYTNSGKVNVALTGNSKGQRQSYTYPEEFPMKERKNKYIARLWASKLINTMLNEVRIGEKSIEEKDSIMADIQSLGYAYGIVTQYTAYLFTTPTYTALTDTLVPILDTNQIVNSDSLGQNIVESTSSNRDLYGILADSVGGQANYIADYSNTSRSSGAVQTFNVNRVKYVVPKTFVLDETGVWIEANIDMSSGVQLVKIGSREFNSLLQTDPEMGKFASAGENVIFHHKGNNFFLNDGRATLADSITRTNKNPSTVPRAEVNILTRGNSVQISFQNVDYIEKLKILTLDGRKVLSRSEIKSSTVNLKSLKRNSVYLLQAQLKGQTITEKFFY